MPQVFNKKSPDTPSSAIYVGRPTVWGNPFSHRKHGTLAEFVVDSRDEAVDSYREWLLAQPELVSRARSELSGKDLVCWCAPARCHASVLIEIANSPEYGTDQQSKESPSQISTQSEPDTRPVFTGRFRRTLR